MIIQKDSRQIPKAKKYTAAEEYFDLLYAHLQIISEEDKKNNFRYIPYKSVNYTQWGQVFVLRKSPKSDEKKPMSRQTVAKKFKNLISLGLIQDDADNKRYILAPLDNSLAFLVSKPVLQRLVSVCNENTISIFIYLINRFIANKNQPFEVPFITLKDYCGLSTNTRSNDYIINNILEALKDFGLVEYTLTKQETDTYKTTYTIQKVYNTLKKER